MMIRACFFLLLCGIDLLQQAKQTSNEPTKQEPVEVKAAAEEPPREWIDPSTGHRVIRLSDEPGSASLYFHQNAYTASGDRMVFTTRKGLSTVNLRTRKIEPLVEGRAAQVVVGRETRQVFYTRDGSVYTTHLDSRATREITKLPPEIRGGSGLGVNADETLLAGSYVEGGQRPTPPAPLQDQPQLQGPGQRPAGRERGLEARWAARLPMRLYTINIKTGEIKTFHPSNDWLNHVQFSPTDPTLIMFCHEGPWHKVDRIWTVRTDGTGLQKIHTRTMDMEIAGHEFFSPDGKIIWYDLQTPRGEDFWVGGYVIATGERIYYHLQRDEWSVHFNVSPDGKLFAGDGGGPGMVAHAKDGQWIYLFRPKMVPSLNPEQKGLIKPGVLSSERLANMAKHDYKLEPNVSFTPDAKWIVFRSNMHGPTHVYAVEVEKAR